MAAHATAFDKYLRYQMIAFCFRGEIAAASTAACATARWPATRLEAIVVLEAHIRGCVDYTLTTGVARWLAG